jgi:hypothetical protein
MAAKCILLLSLSRSPTTTLAALNRYCTTVERSTGEEAPLFPSQKAYRRFKSEVYRENRKNPQLEESARLKKCRLTMGAAQVM